MLFSLISEQPVGIIAQAIDYASVAIEILAVIIILGAVISSTIKYAAMAIRSPATRSGSYIEYKHSLGKALLLGLEILVAADVIRTIALEPTMLNVATLGLLVLVRTFLSWSLLVEIEGRWPWQAKRELNKPIDSIG